MLNYIYLGLLLGWGAAIPLGPMNLEIMRRNLRFGTRFGVVTGFGACSADVIYLCLISVGALIILQHPMVLTIVGILGALILAYFGISALRLPVATIADRGTVPSLLINNYLQGLLMTLVNPYTILFWASVSSHVVISADLKLQNILLSGLGVILGTVSWVLGLNLVLHHTRHKLSANAIHWLNRFGGVILLGFAGYSFYQAVV